MLRLPRNLYSTLRKCCTTKSVLDLAKGLRLPRNLYISSSIYLSVYLSIYHLTCACHEICTSPRESAAPATTFALHLAKSAAPATKSVLDLAWEQDAAPATKSAPQVAKALRLKRDLHLRNIILRGRAIGELSETVAHPWRTRTLNRGTLRDSSGLYLPIF